MNEQPKLHDCPLCDLLGPPEVRDITELLSFDLETAPPGFRRGEIMVICAPPPPMDQSTFNKLTLLSGEKTVIFIEAEVVPNTKEELSELLMKEHRARIFPGPKSLLKSQSLTVEIKELLPDTVEKCDLYTERSGKKIPHYLRKNTLPFYAQFQKGRRKR